MGLRPPRRQRRVFLRQPPHAVVHGRLRHDRRRHVGRDVHLRSRLGRRRRLFLHADGRGLHGRTADRRFRADSHVLPPEGGVALRIPRRPLRRAVAPYRGVVFLRLEDAGGGPSHLCGLRRDAVAGLQPLRTSVLAQCGGHDALRMALHPAGRRQVADLDRYAQDGVSGGKSRAVDRLHHAGAGHVPARNDPRGRRVALFEDVFLRRPGFGPLFLEDVCGGHRAADRHDGTRSGHDAAQPELRHAARLAEKYRPHGRQPDFRDLPVPRAGRAALHLHGPQRAGDARKGRSGLFAGRSQRRIAGIRWHTVRYRTYFKHLFSRRIGPYGPHDFVYGRYP